MLRRVRPAVLAALCVTAASVFGDTPLKDPFIPDGELAVYRMEEGDREWFFTEKVQIGTENGYDIYGFFYEAEYETTEVKIQKNSMVPFFVNTVNQGDAMTIESSTKVSLPENMESQEIIVLSFSDLKYTLRGFPFGQDAPDLDIAFLSANGGEEEEDGPNFEIRVSYLDTEEIAIDGSRLIECHKLELKMRASGFMRVINSFVGKTYFWYSVDAPHYLVAYEGSSGFPGSAKSYITLVNYSGW